MVVLLIGIAAFVVAFVPLGGGPIVVHGSPLLGKPAPDVELTALDGTRVRVSDYRGRPIVIHFWASWCTPCRAEFPQLVQARAAHADDRLEILGIIHDDTPEDATAFAREQGASWPLFQDTEHVAWNAYGSIGLPMSFFVDAEGIVRAVSYGPVNPAALPDQLKTIL